MVSRAKTIPFLSSFTCVFYLFSVPSHHRLLRPVPPATPQPSTPNPTPNPTPTPPAPPRSAPNDLPEAAQIRSLLLSLRHLRLSKIRSALRPPPASSTPGPRDPYNNNGQHRDNEEEPDTGAFSGRGEYMSLTGFTPLEVVQMRGMFTGVLRVVGKLSGGVDEVDVLRPGQGQGEDGGGGVGGFDDQVEDEDDLDMEMR
ncbi:hypothetical protein QFC24_004584 [Naganishia onofrii]|uniref:Uncharacterized protein n=1 Tax=Naganishia onofrii TaxID=1851511 RepID=A0ACC2XED6_9TREE|nr:hypothetical protein QFC24_004584 [Naganishia onofrii]